MELQLDTLIEKIKSNGIQEGQQAAKELVSSAEKKAEGILAQAQAQAAQIVEKAQEDSDTLMARGKDALKQAERDLLLTLEGKLKDLGNKFISHATQNALTSDKLVDIIKTALSSWDFGSNTNIFVHLSASDAQNISKAAISGALKSGGDIEVKVDNSIQQGFRISSSGQAGGSYSFDFTADTVQEALAIFLTPNILELLR